MNGYQRWLEANRQTRDDTPAPSKGTREREGGGGFSRPIGSGVPPLFKPAPAGEAKRLKQLGEQRQQESREARAREQGYTGSAYDENPVFLGERANQFWGEALGGATGMDEPGYERALKSFTTETDQTEQAAKAEQPHLARLYGATPNVKELSWDEYDALSPRERAAADANTLLVNAINADMSAGGQAADADQEYLGRVEALFGKQGGSETYAPNTVGVLEQLGIRNLESGDLDQYLNQSALLTQEDLANIDNIQLGKPGLSGAEPRTANAVNFSTSALTGIADMLASGSSVLGTANLSGGELNELDELFESLAMRSNFDVLDDQAAGEVLGLFLENNPTLDETRVSRYFEDRLNAYDYGTAAGRTVGLGRDVPEAYISPAEFRAKYYAGGE